MSTCQALLDTEFVDLGYVSRFDNEQGMMLILDGEVCWEEVVNTLRANDNVIQQQIVTAETAGLNLQEQGLPTFEQYVQMRDGVVDYTSGKLLMTNWMWSKFVPVGESHGVCISNTDEGNVDAYWSCWEWTPTENRPDGSAIYDNMNRSYLIDPTTWTETSRLDDYQDLGFGALPGLYGGWLCSEPEEIFDMYTAECMRFLPNASYSNTTDITYGAGPAQVMTYSTERFNTTRIEDNESLIANFGDSAFERWTVDLSESGAWSGLSAVGFALASALALSF